jgi:16S rRNA (guanine966-N2)-methyltransferase
VRIIGGRFRGTRLYSPKGIEIRPTADRLRESIFNILGTRLHSKRVLDRFAGTGAMGIEALSRGSTHAVFIDQNPMALDLIRRNISKVRAAEQTTIIPWNIARSLQCLCGQEAFDLVFVDPPYRKGLIQRTLANLQSAEIGFTTAIIEHNEEELLGRLPENARLRDQRRYGKTLVSILDGVL